MIVDGNGYERPHGWPLQQHTLTLVNRGQPDLKLMDVRFIEIDPPKKSDFGLPNPDWHYIGVSGVDRFVLRSMHDSGQLYRMKLDYGGRGTLEADFLVLGCSWGKGDEWDLIDLYMRAARIHKTPS